MVDIGVRIARNGMVEPFATLNVSVYTKWLLDPNEHVGREALDIAEAMDIYTNVLGLFHGYLLPRMFGMNNQTQLEGHKSLTKEALFKEIKNTLYAGVTSFGLGFSED
jgi:hypothetical protein